jgi:hypothetical protein
MKWEKTKTGFTTLVTENTAVVAFGGRIELDPVVLDGGGLELLSDAPLMTTFR